jgi:hypothetical protein
MRRLLVFAMFLGAVLQMCAQGGIHTNAALNTGTGSPFASVRVCAITSTGIPCTPTAAIYSDVAETQSLGNPMSADLNGNYSFYATPGFYIVQVTALNQVGPYFIYLMEVPSDPQNPIFQTVTLTSPITQNLQGATKQYVDQSISTAISNLPATFYQTVQNHGAAVAQRSVLNFVAPLVAVDNPGAARTDVTFNATGNGGTIVTGGTAPGSTTNCAQWDGHGNVVAATGPCSGLVSFNGRTFPAAVPTLNDYSFSLISGTLGLTQVLPITSTYTMKASNAVNATQWDHTPNLCGTSGGKQEVPTGTDTGGNATGCFVPVPAKSVVATANFTSCPLVSFGSTDLSCVATGTWSNTISGGYSMSCIIGTPFTGGSTDPTGLIQTTYGLAGASPMTSTGFTYFIANQHSASAGGTVTMSCVAVQ